MLIVGCRSHEGQAALSGAKVDLWLRHTSRLEAPMARSRRGEPPIPRKVRGQRSNIVAMPCPTPMHSEASPLFAPRACIA